MADTLNILILLLQAHMVFLTDTEIERLVQEPGHLRPFGSGRPVHDVPETQGFPYPRYFFENHVTKSQPLLMRGAAKLSRGFTLWTDDYFLSLDEPADSTVLIEAGKKENRTDPRYHMSFKDYIRVYNNSDEYMVNSVPIFLAPDFVIPGPLQCEPILEGMLVDNVMWFSSGGTKSVVHTDSVDNINCLFRGEKELIFVDPAKYADKVDLDHPEGAYSDIDVDKVDYTKYPGLAEVEFHRVWMNPGDCLYIPYKWVHQVRSFGSNLAVNIWWDYHLAKGVDMDMCPDVFDPELTLDKVQMSGFDMLPMNIDALKDHFIDFTRKGFVDVEGMVKIVAGDIEHLKEMDGGGGYKAAIMKIFQVFDQDGNGRVVKQEVENTTDEDWTRIQGYMGEFDAVVANLEDRWEELHGDMDEPDQDEKDEL